MTAAEWFVVPSGSHAGEPHMAGWMLTAHRGSDKWLTISICPRCGVPIVPFLDMEYEIGGWSPQQRIHEKWHAETDWPIPDKTKALVKKWWTNAA